MSFYGKYSSGGSGGGGGGGTVTSVDVTDAGIDGISTSGGPITTAGVITLSQHVADSTHNGYLSSTDWTTFNNKQSSLTLGNLTDVGTDGITVTGGTGAVVGSGTSISQQLSDSTHNGYLSSTDWSTFNGKQSTVSFGTFGSTPNTAGGVISAGVITLQPADATNPGGISTTTQTIAGAKTLSSTLTMSGSSGIIWGTDGGGDIGASNTTNRPNKIYAKTEMGSDTVYITTSGSKDSSIFNFNSMQNFQVENGPLTGWQWRYRSTVLMSLSSVGTVTFNETVGCNIGTSTVNRPDNIYLKVSTVSPLLSGYDDSTANSSPAGSLTVRAGNKSAGTGNGGAVSIEGGTSSGGTAGAIGFKTANTTVGGVSSAGLWTLGASGGTQTHVINGTTSNTGNVVASVAGKGLQIKEGSNARMGTAVLVAGAVSVSNTSVTANTRIFVTTQSAAGINGALYVNNISAGTSFDIVSTNPADVSTVAWFLVEPS